MPTTTRAPDARDLSWTVLDCDDNGPLYCWALDAYASCTGAKTVTAPGQTPR